MEEQKVIQLIFRKYRENRKNKN